MSETPRLSQNPGTGILVSDFDGTITRFDFYDLACQMFPEITQDFWRRYEQGELSHFEALRRIFAGIRAPEEKLLTITRSMQIDPHFTESAARLKTAGWEIIVASAGCDWYIRRLLREARELLTIHANPGEFFPDQGLIMHLPDPSPFFSQELGVNKVAIVKDALARSSRVAFAGDGRPDLAPALLVAPKRRFAKSWLAKKLHEINEPFRPFEDWSEIPKILLKESTL